jgi:hypothetical protein
LAKTKLFTTVFAQIRKPKCSFQPHNKCQSKIYENARGFWLSITAEERTKRKRVSLFSTVEDAAPKAVIVNMAPFQNAPYFFLTDFWLSKPLANCSLSGFVDFTDITKNSHDVFRNDYFTRRNIFQNPKKIIQNAWWIPFFINTFFLFRHV